MSKKSKKVKKPKEYKTVEERSVWTNGIIKQFSDLGCTLQYPAMKEFYKLLGDYVKTGESVSGKIDFPECPRGGREIHYILTNSKGKNNTIQFLMKNRKVVKDSSDPHAR